MVNIRRLTSNLKKKLGILSRITTQIPNRNSTQRIHLFSSASEIPHKNVNYVKNVLNKTAFI